MKITYIPDATIALIEEFEGFRPKPYLCPAGKATIGLGSTFYPDGKAVKLTDPAITKEKAYELAKSHLLKNSAPVLERRINVALNQNQIAALLDFTYNTGGGYMDDGVWKPYQLWDLINKKTPESELREYWEKCAIKGGGKVEPGLIRRRKAEAKLYFS